MLMRFSYDRMIPDDSSLPPFANRSGKILNIFPRNNAFNKLDIKNYVEKRLEAERIVRCCMHIRNNQIRNIYKMLA